MQQSAHLSNYINTILFAIIASMASLILLFVMYAAPQFVPFLVTAEVGLLGVIIYLVATLMNTVTDYSPQEQSKIDASKIACPDYFTVGTNGASTTCTNTAGFKEASGFDPSTDIDLSSLRSKTDQSDICTFVNRTTRSIPWLDLQTVCNKVLPVSSP